MLAHGFSIELLVELVHTGSMTRPPQLVAYAGSCDASRATNRACSKSSISGWVTCGRNFDCHRVVLEKKDCVGLERAGQERRG
jgi:hypothetical protein